MKKLMIISISFLLLWGGWYICYPYYLMWLEGFSFFSTLPDFVPVSLSLKSDFFHYIGSFLLQFYTSSIWGAAVQALLPVAALMCIWMTVKRLFMDPDSLFWLPFAAMPAVVYAQLDDMTLAKTCAIVAALAVLAAVVYVVTFFVKTRVPFPAVLRHKVLIYIVPSVCVLLSLNFIRTAPLCRQYEDITRLTYMAEHERWDDIMQSVSRKDAISNEYKRKYMLLSLIETGNLPEMAFKYGLSSSGDFVFTDAADPLALQYNARYYRALGLYNGVIYCAYQQSLQSLPGICSDAVRTLADTYIELNDQTLAKKYIDIMDHAPCNGKWVRECRARIDAAGGSKICYTVEEDRFVLQDFYKDIASLVTRYPDEKKYADILLCGLLADRDGNTFFNVFDMVYKSLYNDGKKIPELYQEALCLIASQEPEILDMYKVDENVRDSYKDFAALKSQGRQSQAKKKYSDTYWAYSYR